MRGLGGRALMIMNGVDGKMVACMHFENGVSGFDRVAFVCMD